MRLTHIAALMLIIMLGAPCFAGEVRRCVGPDNTVTYLDTPCPATTVNTVKQKIDKNAGKPKYDPGYVPPPPVATTTTTHITVIQRGNSTQQTLIVRRTVTPINPANAK